MTMIIAARKTVEQESEMHLRFMVAQVTVASTAALLAGLAQDGKQAKAIQKAAGKLDFLSILQPVDDAHKGEIGRDRPLLGDEKHPDLDEERGLFKGRPLPMMSQVLGAMSVGRDGMAMKRGVTSGQRSSRRC